MVSSDRLRWWTLRVIKSDWQTIANAFALKESVDWIMADP